MKRQQCALATRERVHGVEAGLVSEPEHYRLSSAHPEHTLELNGYEEAKEHSQ